MIRYSLVCLRDHAFEAWFPDSDGFERQSGAGQVACPCCGETGVRKAVMAPAVRRPAAAVEGRAAAAPGPSARDAHAARLRAAVREMHDRLKRDAVDVGSAFPAEARAIHDGEAPERAIYGTATGPEVRALIEDGVGVLPIPVLPDERH